MENEKKVENFEEESNIEGHDSACPCPHEHTIENEQKPSLEEELASYRDKWLRSVADAENLRRRFQKEKEDALKYASSSFAKDIIVIADYIEQALKTMEAAALNNETIKPFVEGLKMTADEIHTVFSRQGIKKIDPENKKFDPNFHQAMMEVDVTEVEPGSIIQILQNGYTMHDRLLRPSLVSVAKKN
ncbi:MAG: nucleotide exchange factor GrpE [Proteobacteria bacterium]|nr:nucleotide exchange factor GrpE [Pseudomonadota bacterium]